MRRLFQFTAIVALTLWVPTTVHCNLDALLGWATQDCCGEHEDGSTASADHCAVEEGGYRLANGAFTVSAPDLLMSWFDCVADVCPIVETPESPPAAAESPPGLVRTWQFVARAALPVRAPSHVS